MNPQGQQSSGRSSAGLPWTLILLLAAIALSILLLAAKAAGIL